ncbi:hypothetical protein WICPIJ_000390 [Wickerhamomyces pijperi]|uniref:Uncharacterized protein n=1 Tax=Wickerhamomyces pijperi TaxID=599730 RepID=A0A9P8QCX1_WICPI|nr:hypothetical protein WICPIJ_000390 [Wickerhamomyces pijperi]
MAKPQVGKATQAAEDNLKPEKEVLSSLYLAMMALTSSSSSSETLQIKTGVLNSTVLNETSEVVQSGFILDPAEMINIVINSEVHSWLELLTPQLFNLGLVHFNTKSVNGVFQSGILTVLSVTVVSLNKHNLFTDNVDLILGHKPEVGPSTRIGLLVVVSSTHTTTN